MRFFLFHLFSLTDRLVGSCRIQFNPIDTIFKFDLPGFDLRVSDLAVVVYFTFVLQGVDELLEREYFMKSQLINFITSEGYALI